MTVTGTATDRVPEAVVMRWVGAFNARDLAGALACMAPDVELHPLRMNGLERCYHGLDGVELWFQQLALLGHDDQFEVTDLRCVDPGQVLAAGRLRPRSLTDDTSFCAVYGVSKGLIVTAHHYFSDPALLERVGRVA